jgi:preprotein translocase subunit SecD
MKRLFTSFILLTCSFAYATEMKSLTFNPVDNQPLLTKHDFTEGKVVTRKGKVIFEATLSDGGAAKLKEYSSSHVGERLAIMNGDEVVAAPVIRVPMNRKIEIDALTKVEADQLAQMINQRD